LPSKSASPRDPFLITENMWPRGCALDCQRGRHRAVCGSNGRLYKSLCAFQRARCINTQLRLAPRAHCSGTNPRSRIIQTSTGGVYLSRCADQSKCQLARAQALEASAQHSGGHVSPAAAAFVAECGADGHFLPVQCHNQTRYCWCSMPDGKPVSGTSVLHLMPDCTGQIYLLQQSSYSGALLKWQCPGGQLAPLQLLTGYEMLVKKKGCVTCERERASLLSRMSSSWQEERFVPECTADGRYSPAQCHAATGYCWCVRVDSGRPLPGTSTRFPSPSLSTRPSNTPPSGSASPSSNAPSSSAPDDASPAAPEAAEFSGPEAALRWRFGRLDADSSGSLSEREARPLRQFLRRRLKPRRCAKKFAQHCDGDGDRGLTLEELRVCLGL
uniref:Thyroglobulin type-1 domain-containing protein n=1 Tax=Cyclopterus lumpus TaxID=8103 RepID=A0A8C2WQ04_CYCLU